EIATLISALGTGIGVDEFKLDELRYNKVVIMTDADIDGAHIRTLLLTFFFRQMPEIIEKGHLYIAQPPLYKVKRGRKEQYVYDDRALQKTLVEMGSSDTSMTYSLNGEDRGGKLDAEEFQRLIKLLDTADHQRHLLEQRGMSFEKYLSLRDGENDDKFPLYKVVYMEENGNKTERFLYTEQEYDGFVHRLQENLEDEDEELEIIEEDDYQGLARTRNEPNVVRPHKFHEAKKLGEVVSEMESFGIPISCFYGAGEKEDVENNPEFCIHTGRDVTTVSSLAEIIPAVREMGRKGMQVDRYKGLGEMNADELSETTLDPESRTVVQVKVGDAIEADNYFSILAGKDVKRRREFIEMHALEATNLDI
ncbi:MAG: toprim domain-containing protein, partial [Planctomycetota bacterium]